MEALLPLIITFGLMWALLIRPQQRRVRQHQELVATLSTGDEVITTGGIVGTIAVVVDDIVTLEVAPGTSIRVLRSAVQTRIAPFEASELIDDDLDALEDAYAEDAYIEDAYNEDADNEDVHPGEPVPGARDITGVMPVVPPPADPPPPPTTAPPTAPPEPPPSPPTGEKA